MNGGYPVRLHKGPNLSQSTLVVGWTEDLGNLGRRVTDYLRSQLKAEQFAEIEPEDFFTLGGVAIEANVARFPESKFYSSQEHGLVIFQSDAPGADWYRFLDSVLEVAQNYCRVKDIYVVGAMVSFAAHTMPRQLLTVVNSTDMKEALGQYDLAREMDYQTQPGERPTLNSFLLWIAQRRNIAGVSLWAAIPFYLVSMEDAQAQKRVLTFLDQRLDLRIDFSDLDQRIRQQNEELARARSRFSEIDNYISRLESNLMLSEQENGELIKKIEDFLKEGN